jgi:alkylation response protein AidB-like acyl-CoA dehydrogenase
MDFELNPEELLWRDTVREFAGRELRPQAAEADRKAEFPGSLLAKMAPIGLLGLNIPDEHRGAGVDAVGAALAIEELGWGDGAVGLSVAAHNGLGCAPITLFGNEEQRSRWLPTLAVGGMGLAALALTEPGGGSDLAGSVQTRAERHGDHWVLNGSKAWITNASLAQLIITLCRTDAGAGKQGFSLIVVPVGTPGLTVLPAEHKLGVRASPTHALTYENVRVPADFLLGQPGDGLRQSLEVLDGGRISIGALSVGIARAAHEESLRYAQERPAFGVPIAQHEAVQFMLADAATHIDAAHMLVLEAAWLKAKARPFSRQAAQAKLFASETAERVCRNAIQVLGSYGYSADYPVERMYRDARLMTIGEGTSEILRMVIARRILESG